MPEDDAGEIVIDDPEVEAMVAELMRLTGLTSDEVIYQACKHALEKLEAKSV